MFTVPMDCASWAQAFVAAGPPEAVAAMTQALRDGFEHRFRDEEGVKCHLLD